MNKRCIGIDIGPSYLRAVQVACTAGRFHIEKLFSRKMRRTTDSPEQAARTLVGEYGFDKHADIAAAMPRQSVFFRNVQAGSAALEQIRSGDLTALEHSFPIEPGRVVAQVYSYHRRRDGSYLVLTTAAAREALRERLSTLSRAKMHPKAVDVAIFAVHSTLVINHPEVKTGIAIIAYMDESCLTLAVVQNNSIVIVRKIPAGPVDEKSDEPVSRQLAELLAKETQITWQKVIGAKIPEDTRMYLVAESTFCRRLAEVVEAKLPCKPIILDPYAQVKSPPEYKADAAMAVAEGLALRLLAPEQTNGVDFLGAAGAGVGAKLDRKKEIITFATLIAAIVIAWMIGLFVRLSYMEAKYSRIKQQTKQVFQSTLPQERNIVNPLAQLAQKLRSMRTDYAVLVPASGAGSLEILHAISTSIPPDAGISIDNLLITPESVRLTGTSRSFESLYAWQQRLEESRQFSVVDVQDVRTTERNDLVSFTVLISLAEMEQA